MATQSIVMMRTFCWILMFQRAVCFVIPGIQNIAQHKPTTQSSTYYSPRHPGNSTHAVDGNINGNMESKSCAHTLVQPGRHWWMVDLEDNYTVHSIRITNRWDCCSDRLQNFIVEVSEKDPKGLHGFPGETTAAICIKHTEPLSSPIPVNLQCDKPVTGRYVRVAMESRENTALTLCEFEVFDRADPHLLTTTKVPELKGPNTAFNKPAKQAGTDFKWGPERAVDEQTLGNHENGDCAEVRVDFGWQWWMVDLGHVYSIDYLRLTARYLWSVNRFSNFTVEVSLEDPANLPGFPGKTNATVCMTLPGAVLPPFSVPFPCVQQISGRYVRVIRYTPEIKNYLTICDFQVYARSTPTTVSTTTATEAPPISKTSLMSERPSMIYLWNKWQEWIKKLQQKDHSFPDDCPTFS